MATVLRVIRKVVRTGQGDGLVITGEAGIGTHLRAVFGKLGVRSRVQLTNFMNHSDGG